MTYLVTTLGPMTREQLGMILPHEHIFVDMRMWHEPGFGEADAADVVRVMAPEVVRARRAGVTALVESTPMGVGRRADLDRLVSEVTGLPIVVPTGLYRVPFIPDWAQEAPEGALRDWMIRELTEGILGAGVVAGWIKLSAGDDGITECETKILRAAAQAGAATGAVIGSHTIRGRVVRDQLDILERAGYRPDRFIWIHTQAEPDVDLHLELARRGIWLEYDGIGGNPDDETYVKLILRALDAGFGDQLLLSQDRGWYDPSKRGGGEPKSYTYITETFLPRLREAGVDEATIQKLTCDNPFRAFAR